MDIGMLKCRLYESQIELGTISINPKSFSRNVIWKHQEKNIYLDRKFKSLDFKNKFLKKRIALYLYDSTGTHNLIGDKDGQDDYVCWNQNT